MKDRKGERDDDQPSTSAEVSWALHELVVAAALVDISLGQRLGLNPADYQAMKHLMTSTGPLGTVELGALVGITSGSATGLVDRLERAGHLKRHRDLRDRRRLVLQPTAEAIENAATELEPLNRRLREALEDYSEHEHDIIVRFLREAGEIYRAYGKRRPEAEVDGSGS